MDGAVRARLKSDAAAKTGSRMGVFPAAARKESGRKRSAMMVAHVQEARAAASMRPSVVAWARRSGPAGRSVACADWPLEARQTRGGPSGATRNAAAWALGIGTIRAPVANAGSLGV